MDADTQKRFAELWNQRPKIRLEDIATQLGYSFQSLAKWRMILGLEKRYGFEDDGDIPTPPVIQLRCQQQQTNWTNEERKRRWRGTPHTIYASTSTCDY